MKKQSVILSLQANKQKSRHFAGLSGLCADPSKRLFWHAETRCLAALSTKKRQIQIYDPVRKCEVVALDVSSVNPVLGERENKVNCRILPFRDSLVFTKMISEHQ